MENYSIKERTKEETQLLERVKLFRKIELASQKTAGDLTVELLKADNIKDLVKRI